MSEDLIRRSDAIKAIANLHILADEEEIFRVYANNPHSMTTDFEGTLIDAINAIKSIPTADRPQEWIPCSERLPSNFNEDEAVLATTDVDGHRVVLMLAVDVKRFYLKGHVSAWMPLPKPWKGADDE